MSIATMQEVLHLGRLNWSAVKMIERPMAHLQSTQVPSTYEKRKCNTDFENPKFLVMIMLKQDFKLSKRYKSYHSANIM